MIMKEKVIEILKEVLEDDNVNESTSKVNNPNWDSLRHLNLIVELESEFDYSFEPHEIAAIKSVNDILFFFQKNMYK